MPDEAPTKPAPESDEDVRRRKEWESNAITLVIGFGLILAGVLIGLLV